MDQSLGENSKKKCTENTDSERPLKKAKYLWQVKGKYHLKDNTSNGLNENSVVDKETVNELPSTKLQCKNENDQNENNIHEVLNMNNNLAQARNKNICSDRSCIEALIANSDKIMDFPEPESPPKNIDKSISDEIPITLVKPNPKNEDYYLRKWQARQIAKGFVDNTINRVLESWMVAPFDAADFVENCDNGGQIENQGILMAIQSHGLQSGTRESCLRNENDLHSQGSSSNNTFSVKNNCICSKPRSEIVQNTILPPFHHRSDDFGLKYYENLCVLKDTEPLLNNSFVHSRIFDKPLDSSDMEDSVDLESSLNSENDNNYDSLKMNDTDFLDAAVAVAIQKKGLTSFNYVDCG